MSKSAPALSLTLVVGSLLVVVAIIYGMEASHRKDIVTGSGMPPGATNIVDLGQSWYEFDYKGSRYLYHAYGAGETARESMVRLEIKPEQQ